MPIDLPHELLVHIVMPLLVLGLELSVEGGLFLVNALLRRGEHFIALVWFWILDEVGCRLGVLVVVQCHVCLMFLSGVGGMKEANARGLKPVGGKILWEAMSEAILHRFSGRAETNPLRGVIPTDNVHMQHAVVRDTRG